jgi:hypothetical protein
VRSDRGHHPKDLPAVTLLAGFQVHVHKPVDPYDLLAVVASVARRTDFTRRVSAI